MYNINRPKNKQSEKPSKFHPMVKKPKAREATPEELEKLLGPLLNKQGN